MKRLWLECRCAWGTTHEMCIHKQTQKRQTITKGAKTQKSTNTKLHKGTQKGHKKTDNYRKRPKHKNTNKMTFRVVVVLCMVFKETVCGVVPRVAKVHVACSTVRDSLCFAWKMFASTSTWCFAWEC